MLHVFIKETVNMQKMNAFMVEILIELNGVINLECGADLEENSIF